MVIFYLALLLPGWVLVLVLLIRLSCPHISVRFILYYLLICVSVVQVATFRRFPSKIVYVFYVTHI
jgi:uncharacterized membrane protein YoaK (UPF0700 family)